MNIDNKNEDEYFEIKKITIEDFDKAAKEHKTFLLRADIAFGVLSVLTSTLVGIHGANPFLAYIQLYTIPIAILTWSNIKSLLIIKKKRLEILDEKRKLTENPEVSNEEKKL